MQFFIFYKELIQNDQQSSNTPLNSYFHKKSSINLIFFPLEIIKITIISPFFYSIYFYLYYMLLQLSNTFSFVQMIDNAQTQNGQQLPYINNQIYDDINLNEPFLADMLQEDTIKLSGFSIYERPHLWNSIQYQFKSREQAKMEINEEVLNEIISQRNVPNMKSLYVSKARRHNLSLNKQLSTTKKDIVSLAKKLNRRQLAKNRGFEESSQKWLWKQQKLFVWIIIYYSEVKFLQLNSFGQKDFLILNKLFPLKSQQFLRYQYYLTFCVDRDLRVAWNQQEIGIFDKILINQQDQKNLYHWKKVSFLLFRQSNGNFFKSAQSCRNRWENHSNPNLNKKLWSTQEDHKLLNSTSQFGSKWAKIARSCFQGRTQHMIKNRFRCLSKKFDLDDLTVEEASKILITKLMNHSQPMIKEESQSQNMCKNQQQTYKDQQQGTMIIQQDKQTKQVKQVKQTQQQIVERPFLQLRKMVSNLLTIDEILSLSRSQQELHIQFQQFGEQWLDGFMNRIQFFNPTNIFSGDYL